MSERCEAERRVGSGISGSGKEATGRYNRSDAQRGKGAGTRAPQSSHRPTLRNGTDIARLQRPRVPDLMCARLTILGSLEIHIEDEPLVLRWHIVRSVRELQPAEQQQDLRRVHANFNDCAPWLSRVCVMSTGDTSRSVESLAGQTDREDSLSECACIRRRLVSEIARDFGFARSKRTLCSSLSFDRFSSGRTRRALLREKSLPKERKRAHFMKRERPSSTRYVTEVGRSEP